MLWQDNLTTLFCLSALPKIFQNIFLKAEVEEMLLAGG
jgi:hypothetical protein